MHSSESVHVLFQCSPCRSLFEFMNKTGAHNKVQIQKHRRVFNREMCGETEKKTPTICMLSEVVTELK